MEAGLRVGMISGLILGTRGSALALAQADWVRSRLRKAFPRMEIEVRTIKTSGDKKTRAPLARSGTKGLFTKELEEALLRNKIDVAVHSLKDLPTVLPAGLVLAAAGEREDPADVAVFKEGVKVPKVVFTSSPRRAFQARLLWKDAEIREIRGNIETRLARLAECEEPTILLLAAAGLRRLDLWRGKETEGVLAFEPTLHFRRLTLEEMLPAPGQAAIGLETRAADGETQEKLKSINHSPTFASVLAERSFLRHMEGGCATPMAAYAIADLNGLRMRGAVETKAGIWRGDQAGERRDAEVVGKLLAEKCLSFEKGGS